MTSAWFVYLIQSQVGRLYTGISTDPKLRLQKHNGILPGGAKATRSGRPWVIVRIEGPLTKSEAIKREVAIKKLDKPAKLRLCSKA